MIIYHISVLCEVMIRGLVSRWQVFSHRGYIATNCSTYSWPAITQPGLFVAIVLSSCELHNTSHFNIYQERLNISLVKFIMSAPSHSYIVGVSHGPVKFQLFACCSWFNKLTDYQDIKHRKGEGFYFIAEADFQEGALTGVRTNDFKETSQLIRGQSTFLLLFVISYTMS